MAVILSACSGSNSADSPGSATTQSPTTAAPTSSAPSPSTTTPQAAEQVLVSHELPNFEQRTVRFANVNYTITGARVTNQDLGSHAQGDDPAVGIGSFHAIIDLRATNRWRSTPTGAAPEAFTLEIDGEAHPLRADTPSGVVGPIAAGPSQTSFLAFPTDPDTDLSGATLVIGTPPDRPARLDLTGPVRPPQFPATFEIGDTAIGTGSTSQTMMGFALIAATLHVDLPHEHAPSPTGPRADQNELFLQLKVWADNHLGEDPEPLDDEFRLVIDGIPLAPLDVAAQSTGSSATAPVAEPGQGITSTVLFLISADARNLALQVGAPNQDPGLIPFELPTTPTE